MGVDLFRVGNTAIVVRNDEFRNGYRQGYAHFSRVDAHRPLFDMTIHTFIASNLHDPHASLLENAGYITGWMAALLEHRQSTPTTPQAAQGSDEALPFSRRESRDARC